MPFFTPPFLLLLTAPSFISRAFPRKQIACPLLPVHRCFVRDIVLQLSVKYCNNGGVINPENPAVFGCNTYDRLFSNKYTVKDYISNTKLEKGDHYYIQTRHKDLFSHYNLILRNL